MPKKLPTQTSTKKCAPAVAPVVEDAPDKAHIDDDDDNERLIPAASWVRHRARLALLLFSMLCVATLLLNTMWDLSTMPSMVSDAAEAAPADGVCSSAADTYTLSDGSLMPCLAGGTGGRTNATEDTRYTAVRVALAAGVRHIDTAEVYLDEEVVGRAIRDSALRRDALWLTTKLAPSELNMSAFDGVLKGSAEFVRLLTNALLLRHGAREETLRALRGSLRRLNMSYVDQYMIHRPSAERLVEQWAAMLEARSLGLARSVGVSEYTREHLERLRHAGMELPAINEVVFNPWEVNWTTFDYCTAHRIRLSGYRPFGDFSKWTEPPLPAIAARHNKSVAQVLLRWAVQHGVVPIFGSDNAKHVRADVDIFDFALTASEVANVTAMGLRASGNCTFWTGLERRVAPCQ